MQKVITVTTQTCLDNVGAEFDINKFTEKEYPLLDKYLQEGYKVVQIIPVITSAEVYEYSLTFVLEKSN